MNNRILQIWNDTIKTEGYSLYLHSPFCGSKCKYCVYTGKLLSDINHRKQYDEYVNIYLPKAIQNYEPILRQRVPDNLYFGGGTPNLIHSEDLVKICKLIPHFDDIQNKIIDIHPLYLTNEYIQTIIKLGFTTVCIGIQSFDDWTLSLNDRKNPSIDRIKEIVSIFNEAGVYTSIDLMCFITNYNVNDIDILKNDLDIAMELNLDFIDINPNLHFVLSDHKYGSTFEKAVDCFVRQYDEYVSEKELSNTDTLNNRWIYRIIHKQHLKDFYTKVLPYYADDFPYANNNIIGIGDMDNGHSTMSYVHGKLFYIEKNRNNVPTYDIRYLNKNNNYLKELSNILNSYL